MFERFTEQARRAIFFARYEATSIGSPHIEAEHLLLGLLREDKGLFPAALVHEVDSLGQEIRGRVGGRESPSPKALPLSDETKQVLSTADQESKRLGHHSIGTAHLLLGLLGGPNATTARVFRERSLDLGEEQGRLRSLPAGEPGENFRLIRVDNHVLLSVMKDTIRRILHR